MYNSGYSSFAPYYKQGLFSSLKSLNWGNLLTNTQKTLNIVNQTIPLVYQVKPIVNNARTIFRVIGAVKSDDNTNTNNSNNQVNTINNNTNANTINNGTNQPNFFL